jgi:iron complex outermembrane receptor protein
MHAKYRLRTAISLVVMCSIASSYIFAQEKRRSIAQASPTQEKAIQLAPIVIETVKPQALTSRSVKQAREELARIPGGTSVLEAERYRRRSISNLEDVLAFAPGVYSQNQFGGDENRLSIRGSGISQDFAIKGVLLLRNGLPISEADGDFHSQLVESLTARYIEVYRGANALQYGASTLGGAINFVTYDGYTAAPLTSRLETGSYGYLRPQISSGKILGRHWDYYASLSGLYSDGFRDHAQTSSTRFYGNLGYRYSDRAESRLHTSIEDNNQELPGALTRAELDNNPRQANELFKSFGSQNNFNRYRVDLQHTFLFKARDRLDVGTYYETQEIFHPLPFFVRHEDQNNYGLSLRRDMYGRAFGLDNRLIWGGMLALGDISLDDFEPLGDARQGPLRSSESSDVLTSEFFAEDQLQMTDKLLFTLGSQIAYSKRETEFEFTNPNLVDNTIEGNYFGVSPKIGLIWQATDLVQVFGNLSRSFEPPIIAEFNDTTAGVLDDQTATTIEIGTRSGFQRLAWDLAIYHSWLQDEILIVEIPPLPSGNFATSNADQTTHSGVELGFESRLSLDGSSGEKLHIFGTYTYNRFRFDDDPAFGDNEIPGIPPHFVRLEVLYEHPSGFYIGPNLQAASDYFVDFTNTLEADSFVTVGVRAGYDHGDRWNVFIEGQNLGDKAYISSSGVIADAGGQDTDVFNPGLERSVFAGVNINW